MPIAHQACRSINTGSHTGTGTLSSDSRWRGTFLGHTSSVASGKLCTLQPKRRDSGVLSGLVAITYSLRRDVWLAVCS